MAWGWIFGVERRVLRLHVRRRSPSSSPAPVSRRGLIQFKLLHSQLFILFNALLWTLILSRERFGVSPWLRVVSIWVLLTTLSFHRLGASFVRTSLAEHGRLGAAASSRVAGGPGGGAHRFDLEYCRGAPAAWLRPTRETPLAFLSALGEAAAQPLPTALTYPFRVMVRPLTAHRCRRLAAAPCGRRSILLVLHYVWVVRSDTAFEEAAAAVSLQRAQALSERRAARPVRGAGRASPRRCSGWRPQGWPAGAILWKNLVAVTRTRRVRNVALALAVGGVIVTAPLLSSRKGRWPELAGWFAVTWAGAMTVIGPQWVRNDLRGDLLKLDLLRSYPAAGLVGDRGGSRRIGPGADGDSAQPAADRLSGLSRQRPPMEPPLEDRTLLLLAAFVFLPGINLLGMLIQNGAALLYPAWVRLGSGRPAVSRRWGRTC